MELILIRQLYFWKLEKKIYIYIPGFTLKRTGSAKVKVAVVLRKKECIDFVPFSCFPNYDRRNFYDLLVFSYQKILEGQREGERAIMARSDIIRSHGSSNIMLSLEALGDIKPPLPGVISLPCCTVIHI